MIQTQLLKAAIQATPADSGTASAMLPLGNEGSELPLQDGGKAAFADAMARAQLVGKGAPAAQTGEQTPAAMAPDAKSLATDETPAATPPTSDKRDETELPPDDFLQQLQASLRQDVSLVVPPAPLVAQAAVPTAPVIDGNDLPPESQPVSPADAGKPAATIGAATPQALLQPAAEGRGTGETLAQGTAAPRGEAGKSDKGSAPTAVLGKGAQALPADGQLAAPAAQSEEQAAQPDTQVTTQVEDPKAAEPKPAPQPLSGQERAALLAKVSPAQTDAEPVAEVSEPPTAGKPAQSISTEHAAHGAQATPGAHGAQATQGAHGAQASAAKAFGEGLVRVDTQSDASANPDGSKSGDESSQTRAATEPEAKPGQTPAAKPETQAATQGAAGSGAPTPAGADPEPVLTAAPQILARHESQGPQASLTALSAGIQQMEAESAVAARVAVELKQTDMKSKLDEPGQPALETQSVEQSESTPAPQHAQAQPGESRPATEVAARREAQTLPHLKLATPEAPEQLHQKVNLMLTDKLQQVELQLDPLGLGKMKIQIQMGADNQASVHFVVQHGQTREMLEQAMPRLRDMLAGQGIQLGQTQVQQQSQQQAQQGQQQQSQGQSTFNGQGQQGRQESGSFGGSGQGKGDNTARAMSLLVESTNDSGIDFYA